MAFSATLESSLLPKYAGQEKYEVWSATALAADSGVATITARYLNKVTDFDVEVFNGSNLSSYLMTGNQLVVTLPGTTTPTLMRFRLYGRFH